MTTEAADAWKMWTQTEVDTILMVVSEGIKDPDVFLAEMQKRTGVDRSPADEAEHVVHQNLKEMLDGAQPNRPCEMTYMPEGWDETSLPWGDETDRSVGDLIEAGAAPRYSGRSS